MQPEQLHIGFVHGKQVPVVEAHVLLLPAAPGEGAIVEGGGTGANAEHVVLHPDRCALQRGHGCSHHLRVVTDYAPPPEHAPEYGAALLIRSPPPREEAGDARIARRDSLQLVRPLQQLRLELLVDLIVRRHIACIKPDAGGVVVERQVVIVTSVSHESCGHLLPRRPQRRQGLVLRLGEGLLLLQCESRLVREPVSHPPQHRLLLTHLSLSLRALRRLLRCALRRPAGLCRAQAVLGAECPDIQVAEVGQHGPVRIGRGRPGPGVRGSNASTTPPAHVVGGEVVDGCVLRHWELVLGTRVKGDEHLEQKGRRRTRDLAHEKSLRRVTGPRPQLVWEVGAERRCFDRANRRPMR
mmetsp:Transcript_10563/g.26336  ORF Transcript_10563/g.26336 Transcript_10563/m.26336 type:complete len:354 (+) Transcript_10563:54-1115(+)